MPGDPNIKNPPQQSNSNSQLRSIATQINSSAGLADCVSNINLFHDDDEVAAAAAAAARLILSNKTAKYSLINPAVSQSVKQTTNNPTTSITKLNYAWHKLHIRLANCQIK